MDGTTQKKLADYCDAEDVLNDIAKREVGEISDAVKRKKFCIDTLTDELQRTQASCGYACIPGEDARLYVALKRKKTTRKITEDEMAEAVDHLLENSVTNAEDCATATAAITEGIAEFFVVDAVGKAAFVSAPPEGVKAIEFSPEMSAFVMAAHAADEFIAETKSKYKNERKKANQTKKSLKKDIYDSMKSIHKPVAVKVKTGSSAREFNVRYEEQSRPDPFGMKHMKQLVKETTSEWIDANGLTDDPTQSSLQRLITQEYKDTLKKRLVEQYATQIGASKAVESLRLMKTPE